MNAVDAIQINVCLTLSSIQAYLWVQSTVATIVREGEESILPAKIQKIIWGQCN